MIFKFESEESCQVRRLRKRLSCYVLNFLSETQFSGKSLTRTATCLSTLLACARPLWHSDLQIDFAFKVGDTAFGDELLNEKVFWDIRSYST